MRIALITPAGAKSRAGNRNTALRWAGMLRELGHQVAVSTVWDGRPADLMLALHARRSADSIHRFHQQFPERPLIVVLTGTDLYRDIHHDAEAKHSLHVATLLLTLQDQGPLELSAIQQRKARVLYQSAAPAFYEHRGTPPAHRFNVCVIGHLREEKDPFRTAYALPLLGERVHVTQLGRAMDHAHEQEALRLNREQARYRWLGEVPAWRVREVMRRSHAMVISSRMEGGANAICEAIAMGLPVIASCVSGNVGMLGTGYKGFFPQGDEKALAALLQRAQDDPAFLRKLEQQGAARRKLLTPEKERSALARVVKEARRLA